LADLLVLAVLLAAPGWAGWKLVPPDSALLVCGWFGISSLVTFGLYAWDKRCAKRREWRVPERIIHGFELSGGWPGGFLAQRGLRHKSAKGSYQFTFWFIVLMHQYVATDWSLGWILFRAARGWLTSLMSG